MTTTLHSYNYSLIHSSTYSLARRTIVVDVHHHQQHQHHQHHHITCLTMETEVSAASAAAADVVLCCCCRRVKCIIVAVVVVVVLCVNEYKTWMRRTGTIWQRRAVKRINKVGWMDGWIQQSKHKMRKRIEIEIGIFKKGSLVYAFVCKFSCIRTLE